MAQINQKLTVMNDALNTLEKSVTLYKKYSSIVSRDQTNENKELFLAMQAGRLSRIRKFVDSVGICREPCYYQLQMEYDTARWHPRAPRTYTQILDKRF